MVELATSHLQTTSYRQVSPYIRSVFKSAYNQKALAGNFLSQANSQVKEVSSLAEDAVGGPREVVMMTQEEFVLYPAPGRLGSGSPAKLQRFPLSQVLSSNHMLFVEKVSDSKSKDYLIVMTSDLVLHTLELTLIGTADSLVCPHQIKILSSHDTKNVVAASEIPKLKQVIQTAVMTFQAHKIIFILFSNLSYMVATIKDAKDTLEA